MLLSRKATFGPSLAAGFALAASLVALPAPAVRADATGDTMRTLASKYRGAVVMLTVVVRTSGTGADESDTEINTPGCIVDPSGLVVTTDSSIDPASMLAALMPDQASKVTTKVVSAKILTIDGTTIPAQVVLRDSDRNIAFVRPITPLATPATFVDLGTAGDAHIGDAIFCVAQMGKAANHSLSVTQYRIVSVMEHPRTLYIPENMAGASIGNVAFNEQGVPLGMFSLRFSAMRGGGRSFNANDSYLPIVVPAADVVEEVKQALTAKAPAATPPAAPTKPTTTKPAPKGK